MAETSPPTTILVLGSIGHETLLVPRGGGQTGYHRKEGWVGAPLLREMICEALVELSDDPDRTDDDTKKAQKVGAAQEKARVLPDGPLLTDREFIGACVGITTIFKRVPKTSKPKDPDSVLRVATQYSSHPAAPAAPSRLAAHMEKAVRDCVDPGILVLFDFDEESRQGVRSCVKHLTSALGKRTTIIGFAGDMSGEALNWLNDMTPDVTGGPQRTVAIIRAEELRKAGLIIVESGPIERTLRDLVGSLEREPLSTLKARASHLIVLFEDIGAVRLDLTACCARGQVHLNSNLDVIAHDRADKYGRTPGRMSITLAAIARRLAAEQAGQPLPALSDAIRLSLAADSRYFVEGYDVCEPLETLQSTLSYRSRHQLKTLVDGRIPRQPDPKYFLSTLHFPRERSALEAWTRLSDAFPNTPDSTETMRERRLRDIVLKGPEAALQDGPSGGSGPWYPYARIICPFMRVGDIRTFDEEEIAGFTSLMRLFRTYLRNPGWKTPLSIAVFGPPGTGKSFSVKELVKAVNPAAEKPLTFNLSQFTSIDALNDAFHDVQHRVLSSDDVPLVFFDEFDTSFGGGDFGWLKYFLAPMQDGVFRGKAADYSIGRAFFVFAGGTKASFSTFKDLATGASAGAARAAKLPDFVSRLQGFLDIQSVNPSGPAEASTAVIPGASPTPEQLQREVKRAVLLRTFLELYAKPIFHKIGDNDVPKIDPDLIDGLLRAERYVHGSRSLESIVRMSKWIDHEFVPASLPAKPLLEMHVKGLTLRKRGGPVVLS